MKGRIIADWSKIDFANPDHVKLMYGAVQHNFAQMESPVLRAAIQQFGLKGDFPASALQVIEKFHGVPTWDLGYEQIFDIKDFTSSKRNGFEIHDVTSGLTFDNVEEGMKCRVYKMSGTKATVLFDRFGAALGWSKTLFDDEEFWTLEDNAIEFRNKSAQSRAQNHYDLIDATTSEIAWQVPSPSTMANTNERYVMSRDVQTINLAAQTILLAVAEKGYGVGQNTPLILLYPIQLKSRIEQALAYISQEVAGAGSPKGVTYTIIPTPTLMLDSAVKYYIILPKQKLKGGNRMNLTLYGQFDILAYAETVAGWMRYGAAIGDVEQIERCLTS